MKNLLNTPSIISKTITCLISLCSFVTFFTLNAIGKPLEKSIIYNKEIEPKIKKGTPSLKSTKIETSTTGANLLKSKLPTIVNNNKTNKHSDSKQIRNYKQAINQLLYNKNLDSQSLNRIKTFITNRDKISNDLDIVYYKALIYAKISKQKFSFLNDSDTSTFKAIELFDKVIHSPKASHELREICKANIQQICNHYINRGLKYYNMGHYNRAKSNYLISKKIDPGSNNANLYLGCLYLIQGESNKALKMYKQSTNLKNSKSAYYYGMAELFNNDIQKTLKIVDIGLKNHPYNNDLIHKRLRALKKIDNLNEYKSLINKDIPNGAKHYQMAKYYEFVDDNKYKLDSFKKAARYSKNQHEIEFALAVLYYNRAAEYSKIVADKFHKENVKHEADGTSKNPRTKKIKKKEKKKLSDETKLKRYLQLSKEKFVKANSIKSSRLVTERINFINTYLNTLKQQNKQVNPQPNIK